MRPRRGALARFLGGFEFVLGAATAAVLLAWLAVIVVPIGPQPVLVATIAAESGELRFEARHDPVTGTLSVVRVAGGPAPEGRAHEVWVIAPDAAPVSLGLIAEAPLSVEYPAPPAGWVMAVSLEPTGGSPTGAPTGPVLALGEVTDV
jgi:anti-sigma-K factor RskA